MPVSSSVGADDTGSLTRVKFPIFVGCSKCIFLTPPDSSPVTLAFFTRVRFTRVIHPCHLHKHCHAYPRHSRLRSESLRLEPPHE
jgi:hypothetical protein